LHVDRAPLLARLPPAGEQPRRAPVRLRAAPPAVPARRQRAAEPQEALRGRGRDVPLRADDARLLLRAGGSDRHRRAGRADKGRREEADHGLRAQAGRRLRRGSGRGRRGRDDGDPGRRTRTGARPLTPLAAVSLALAAAVGTVEGPATELDVTLDPGARRISGHARLRVVNDGPEPMRSVKLWLYPNTLEFRARFLNDVNFHWLYPGGMSPASMDVSNLRIDDLPTAVTITDVEFVGRRAMAYAELAAPLAPGGAVTVDVDFVTQIPQRYGAFGCDGRRCRLMGGFYPMPARQTDVIYSPRADEPFVARAGRTRVALRLPPGLALVLDGRPIVNDGGVATGSGD